MPLCSGAGSVKRASLPTCDSGSCPTPQAVREAPALQSIPRAQPAKEERETTTLAFYIKMHALSNRCITQLRTRRLTPADHAPPRVSSNHSPTKHNMY